MKKQTIIGIAALSIIISIISCKNNNLIVSSQPLELINKYSLDVEEPSGLDLALDNKSLWTVSDKHNKIFQIDLTGKILKELTVPSNNMEGITLDIIDNALWVVQELLSEILQVDTLGNELQRIYIAGASIGTGGLEGMTINTTNNHIFLLKEKDPGALIELNNDFETILFREISIASDYSGMDYNEIENELWLVSDQDKMIYRCDINGTVRNSYPINVKKAEGIAFNNENNLIYLISDSVDSLYVYKLN